MPWRDVLILTNGDGGDLGVEVQHAVAVHVHQVVSPAVIVVAEEIDGAHVLQRNSISRHGPQSCLGLVKLPC